MFGQKKTKKELAELETFKEQSGEDKKPLKAPKPDPIEHVDPLEIKILTETKAKRLDWIFDEFKENYAGSITSDEIPDIDPEATSLNLLIGIFAELRLIREILSKQK